MAFSSRVFSQVLIDFLGQCHGHHPQFGFMTWENTHAMPLLGMIYNISLLVFNINSCQSCDFWSFWSFSTTKNSDSTEPQAFRSIARWPRPLLSTRAPNASRAAAQPAVRAAAGVPVAVLPWWMSRHSQKRTRWLGWTWLNMHFLEFPIWWLGNHVICLW